MEERVPAPTALYKLLPNKNNLCEGRRAQTLNGRLKGEENSGEALSRQTSSLKSETTEVAWLAEHLQLFALLSVPHSLFFPDRFHTSSLRGDSNRETSPATVDGE